MRLRSLLLSAAVVALLASSPAFAQNHLMPLQSGDTLSLTGPSGNVSVDAQGPVSGNWRLISSLFELGPVWVWPSTSSLNAWVYTQAGGVQHLGDFSHPGGPEPIQIGANQGTVQVAATGETVTVPAGRFRDCARLDFTGMFTSAGHEIESVWFAPNVGTVRWQTSRGSVELVSGSVGGVTYAPVAQADSVEVKVSAPASTIFNRMPPTTPRPTPKITVAVKIKNTGTHPATIYWQPGFPSITRVELIDDQGNVVASVRSYNRAAIMPTDLQPGEFREETVELTPVDSSGAWLPDGNYVLEVKVAHAYDWRNNHVIRSVR